MAQGLRQFAARPSWRPLISIGARIFTGRGLRDAFGQRPYLTWAVTARGSSFEHRRASIYGTVRVRDGAPCSRKLTAAERPMGYLATGATLAIVLVASSVRGIARGHIWPHLGH